MEPTSLSSPALQADSLPLRHQGSLDTQCRWVLGHFLTAPPNNVHRLCLLCPCWPHTGASLWQDLPGYSDVWLYIAPASNFSLAKGWSVYSTLIFILFFSGFFFKCISFESRLQNLNSNPASKINISHFSVLGMDVFWMTLVKKKTEEEVVKTLSEYQQHEFQWCQKSWPQEASPVQNVRKTHHSITKQKGRDVACTVVENEWTLAPLIHHLLKSQNPALSL